MRIKTPIYGLPPFLFLIVYGFLFFYHYLVAVKVIGNFAGGWYGAAIIFTGVVLTPLSMGRLLELKGKELYLSLIFIGLVFYCLTNIVLNTVLGEPFQGRRDVLYQQLALPIWWVSLFFLGLCWNKDLNEVVRAAKILLLSSFVVISLNTDFNTLVFSVRNIAGDAAYTPGADIASHQGIAESIFALLILVITYNTSRLQNSLFCIVGLFGLFLIGSRAEFFAFVLAAAIYVLISLRGISKLGVLMVVLVGLIVILPRYWDLLQVSRVVELFGNFEGSAGRRIELMDEGVADILSNPIFGKYAGHAEQREQLGSYIHNTLSLWRQHGILPFFAYMSLSAFSIAVSAQRIVKSGFRSGFWLFSFYWNILFLFLGIVAKVVFDPNIALGWGLTIGGLLRERKMKNYAKEESLGRARRITGHLGRE